MTAQDEAPKTSHVNNTSSPTRRPSPLAAMLELLREQEEERRLAAVPLADSLIRACASASDGGHRAMERAQATAYEALRCGKADSGNHNSSSEHRVGSDSRLENAVFEKGVKRFVAVT